MFIESSTDEGATIFSLFNLIQKEKIVIYEYSFS
jgi:hypothetical protein